MQLTSTLAWLVDAAGASPGADRLLADGDAVAFGAFVHDHYAKTLENFCSEVHPTFCATQ